MCGGIALEWRVGVLGYRATVTCDRLLKGEMALERSGLYGLVGEGIVFVGSGLGEEWDLLVAFFWGIVRE